MVDQPNDSSDFAAMMSGIKRLHHDRINVYQQRPDKTALSQQKLKQSETDFSEFSFEQLSQTLDTFFDHGIPRKMRRKISQGQLPADNCLDLHGCTQKSARLALSHFFQDAIVAGHKMLIVIHGKGHRSQNNAVLKPLTLHWLSQQHSVLAWCPARPQHGGTGASYVYLRRRG